jgi:hypothetical protein
LIASTHVLLVVSEACLAHYNSADRKMLESKPVMRATDALQAATTYALKPLRATNAEELGSDETATDSSCCVARKNQGHIMKMCSIAQSYIWNASHQVADDGCNRRLHDAREFAGLAMGKPAMGQLQPSLVRKVQKRLVHCTYHEKDKKGKNQP